MLSWGASTINPEDIQTKTEHNRIILKWLESTLNRTCKIFKSV